MYAVVAMFRTIFQRGFDFNAALVANAWSNKIIVISFLVTILGILYTTVSTIIAAISFAMPHEINVAASWVVPSNFNECVTAYFAAKLALYVYEYKSYMARNTMLSGYIT